MQLCEDAERLTRRDLSRFHTAAILIHAGCALRNPRIANRSLPVPIVRRAPVRCRGRLSCRGRRSCLRLNCGYSYSSDRVIYSAGRDPLRPGNRARHRSLDNGQQAHTKGV
jgi:hypothetical protein